MMNWIKNTVSKLLSKDKPHNYVIAEYRANPEKKRKSIFAHSKAESVESIKEDEMNIDKLYERN
jgi:hypothetical protein